MDRAKWRLWYIVFKQDLLEKNDTNLAIFILGEGVALFLAIT